MLQYICVITNEFESVSDNFIHSVSFHQSYDEASNFGNEKVRSLNGVSDYFVYRNVSILEDDFLEANSDRFFPFS